MLPDEERELVETVEQIGTIEAARQTQDEFFRRLSEERAHESGREANGRGRTDEYSGTDKKPDE
jgi:hypothetical protein